MSRIILVISLLLFIIPGKCLALFESGTILPDAEMTNLKGHPVFLSEIKAPLLIKIGTVWCPSCRRQTDEIRYAGEFLQKNGITILEVFLNDSPDAVDDFFSGMKLRSNHSSYVGSKSFAETFQIFNIPRILLVDADRRVHVDTFLLSATELIRAFREMGIGR